MEANLNEAMSYFNKLAQWIKRVQFDKRAQLAFLEDLYVLINDGIPPNKAIDMMTQVTRGISKEIALSISSKISAGQPLAEGMREWFDINVSEIVRVGEEGGALNETLKSAISTLSQRANTLSTIMNAFLYPLMVMCIASGIMVYLNNSVFIQFRTMKPFDQWPQAGRDLVNIANVIENWWWLVIIVLVAIVIFLRRAMSNYTGEFRPMLDKAPPFSFYRRFISARFMETLGVLVANGVVFKQALKIMQYQSTPYLTSHLVVMEHLLGMGKANIAEVLDTGLIDEEDILRLRVMAEVKGFEHGLIRMGVHGSEKSTKTLQKIARVFGGLLLAVDAFLIIVLIRGIYLTGMSMGSV